MLLILLPCFAITGKATETAISDGTWLPGPQASSGLTVRNYRLLERVASLPSTFVPVEVPVVAPQALSSDAGASIVQSSAWILPDALSLPDPNASAAFEEAHSAHALALPSPYECELALAASASYRLHKRVRGASSTHGEVWRAVRVDDASGRPLIVKRMPLDAGSPLLLAGLRERHFGIALRRVGNVARFLDAFEHEGALWLVFVDEGVSLQQVIYTAEAGAAGAVTMRPSAAWLGMRQTQSGQAMLRALVRQSVEGLAALHARNITHRDIKPSNVIVRLHSAEQSEPAGALASSETAAAAARPSLRIADLGSALHAEVLQPHVGLYPESGPSTEEETQGYQPPEAAIGNEPFRLSNPIAYDLWSMGVLTLELLLGTPHVLPLSSRAEAIVRLRFSSQPPAVLRRLLTANALAEHCILPPSHAQPEVVYARDATSASPTMLHECTKAHFAAAVSRTDRLNKLGGAPLDASLVDLAYQLLKWDPDARMSAEKALLHPALQMLPDGSATASPPAPNRETRSKALVCAA
uniref:Protein kinase domain-containing protein n=1 Tax=Calcidiscus leptoporus TaxID=127549 RepID=A0A7S0P5B9_9EUKA|mmetsp:Transcript_56739/g.130279  ORF Transcript_56739/g.130279 Transcript_56739/m.130279 type:complete len:527 (+) Transcript_56739:18-1598(+)